MRQIGLAVRLYADDNDDEFPRSQHSAFSYGQPTWGRAIAAQLAQSAQTWTNLLRSVYHCPSDRRTTPWSYGQNVYFELDPQNDDYAGSPQTWRRAASIPASRPATILQAETPGSVDHVMPHFWMTPRDATDVDPQRHKSRVELQLRGRPRGSPRVSHAPMTRATPGGPVEPVPGAADDAVLMTEPTHPNHRNTIHEIQNQISPPPPGHSDRWARSATPSGSTSRAPPRRPTGAKSSATRIRCIPGSSPTGPANARSAPWT